MLYVARMTFVLCLLAIMALRQWQGEKYRGGRWTFVRGYFSLWSALWLPGFILEVAWMIHPFENGTVHEPYGLRMLGVVLMLMGTLIWAGSQVYLGKNWSGEVGSREDHELVVGGPYALVRHPLYTGCLTFCLGCWLASANLFLLGAVALVYIAILRKAAAEEAEMTRIFGDRYRKYREQTGRLVPRLGSSDADA